MRYLLIGTHSEYANITVYYEGAGGWSASRARALRYTKQRALDILETVRKDNKHILEIEMVVA